MNTIPIPMKNIILDLPCKRMLEKNNYSKMEELCFETDSITFGLSDEKIQTLVRMKENNVIFFPIDVLLHSSGYRPIGGDSKDLKESFTVLNGRHRIVASLLCGEKYILANVFKDDS